ncbi:MAG: branched-chain amino acid transport system substrate-binding protein [Actinomycetota bacterium]
MRSAKATVTMLLVVATLLAACGTRLPDSDFAVTARIAVAGDTPAEVAGAAEELTPGEQATPVAGADSSDEPAATGQPKVAPGSRGVNQASDVGITATTITLGNITAENGVLGDAFAPAVRGLRAWVAATNAKGGVNGRTIILKTCDDREDRSRALACAQKLVEHDKVFALVATNTRAMGGAAQYLNDQAVPVIGIPINNSFYRYPHFWSGYPNSYTRDGKTVGYKGKLVSRSGVYRWFKQNTKATKAAVFTYDIDESKQAGTLFTKGLELEGFQVTSYTVSFAAPSFDQAVAQMQRDGTQLILDGMDDGANRKLCDAMARRNFTVLAKVSTPVSFGENVGTAYNDTCRNSVFIAGTSIPYTATNIPAVSEFRRAFARYQPGLPVHQWAMEAWTQAVMVSDGIRAMATSPTRKGLEDYLRAMRGFTAGGILTGLQYAPTNFDTPTARECFGVSRWLDSKGGWVEAAATFPFCYDDAKQYLTDPLEQGN